MELFNGNMPEPFLWPVVDHRINTMDGLNDVVWVSYGQYF